MSCIPRFFLMKANQRTAADSWRKYARVKLTQCVNTEAKIESVHDSSTFWNLYIRFYFSAVFTEQAWINERVYRNKDRVGLGKVCVASAT